MIARPIPIIGTVREAYGFVSGHLPELIDLGKGPALVAVILGLLFDLSTVFQATPVYTFASMIAFSWFSFYVFRLTLLGAGKARLPAPSSSRGEAPARQRPLLANFMGQTLTLGVAAMGVFFLVTIVVVYPFMAVQVVTEGRGFTMDEVGFEVVDTLVIAFALFALPIAIPLARCALVLPATAIGRDTSFGAAWRLSHGNGVRLAVIWILIAGPYFLGYAVLNAALTDLSRFLGGDGPGLIANILALLLITAIGMTVTALMTHATARAWSRITTIPTRDDRYQGPAETFGVKWE